MVNKIKGKANPAGVVPARIPEPWEADCKLEHSLGPLSQALSQERAGEV